MIAKITRGESTGGLVHYLLGPTKDPGNVHEDQRVIASSEGLDVSRESAHAAGMSQERFIALQMDCARLDAGVEVSRGHVWHLSLSNAAGDRVLADDQWATIARHTMEAMGFDDGSAAPCPWVAIRHGDSAAGNEHVHIAVSLVREDGTTASTWNDYRTASKVCAEMEDRYDLKVVEGRQAGISLPVPSRAEKEIADRSNLAETPRVRLERLVRAAATASRDEAEFVRRLRGDGLKTRVRFGKGGTSKVVGYSVSEPAPPGAPSGYEPVWHSGSGLAKDLSLTRLRDGWEPVDDERQAWTGRTSPGREAASYGPRHAEAARSHLADGVERLNRADPSSLPSWAPAARDAAGVAAQFARLTGDPGWSETERALARSAQLAKDSRRTAVADVGSVVASVAAAHRDGAAGVLAVGAELLRLTRAIDALHEARGELAQARQLRSALVATVPSVQRATDVQGTRPDKMTVSEPVTPQVDRRDKGFER